MRKGEYYSIKEISIELNVSKKIVKDAVNHLMVTPKVQFKNNHMHNHCYNFNDLHKIREFLKTNKNFILSREREMIRDYYIDNEKNCTITLESKINFLEENEL
jgi:Mn-dependent DtxR family transcriptional regulator